MIADVSRWKICHSLIFICRRLVQTQPFITRIRYCLRTRGDDTMQMEKAQYTIKEILDLHHDKWLVVNQEYQRGAVWSQSQKKRLVDSIFRGYPIPLIYLHYIKKIAAGMQKEGYEVIDGQQRINALYEFREGVFKLFDPKK